MNNQIYFQEDLSDAICISSDNDYELPRQNFNQEEIYISSDPSESLSTHSILPDNSTNVRVRAHYGPYFTKKSPDQSFKFLDEDLNVIMKIYSYCFNQISDNNGHIMLDLNEIVEKTLNQK